ncbi:murein transglycosylase A [Acidocella sp.]|uniref:murein transglycosylase A n=1 Tax=Acidocella sp. TaxID=50710 RepID=UPI003D014DD4
MRRLSLAVPLCAALALTGCAATQEVPLTGANAPPGHEVSLSKLPGWPQDNAAAALASFVTSCKAIMLMPPDSSLGGTGLAAQRAGQAGLWQPACTAAKATPPNNEPAARQFFESWFDTYAISGQALITGYFEPEVPGSRNERPGYRVPLYAKPPVAALANLPRAAIDGGALHRKVPVTAYVTNPVDAFMLQIQGSGRIILPDGRILRVGFDGQNGQPYTPIGRILVQMGALKPDDVSYQSISAWLKSHPGEAKSVMEQNARYVFMRPLGYLPSDEGAPGALGVPLTAERSVAVDRSAIPLGAPLFITTTDPITGAAMDHLAIVQDTGGGIHGPDRADIFFGAGPDAEQTAGFMRQPGQLYLLLPRGAPKS